MKISLLSAAIDDLRIGWKFYESQQAGLGDYFQDSLWSDIDSLVLHGGIHPKFFGFHRMLSKRFPFAIYYEIERDEEVLVYRVLDMRQAPDVHDESLRG